MLRYLFCKWSRLLHDLCITGCRMLDVIKCPFLPTCAAASPSRNASAEQGKAMGLILCIIIPVVTFNSCIKPAQVPVIPAIEFNTFTKYGTDSAEVSIDFKDGDGDIGLEPSDTLPPFDTSGIYYNNLYLIYYYKGNDGLFHKYFNILTQDTLEFAYRIPDITPIGQNKILDGEIKVKLYAPIYIMGHTAVRFDIFIFDRALHQSNVVSTGEITVP